MLLLYFYILSNKTIFFIDVHCICMLFYIYIFFYLYFDTKPNNYRGENTSFQNKFFFFFIKVTNFQKIKKYIFTRKNTS